MGTPKWVCSPASGRATAGSALGRHHRGDTNSVRSSGRLLDDEARRPLLTIQYGAPGTGYNVYSTASTSRPIPSARSRTRRTNPVAYKPGGFGAGRGTGNTFQDVHGNWWSTGTPWIG